jgi:hypothetical protein
MTRSVYIIGGAGAGKSTFMSELLAQIGGSPGPLEDLHTARNARGNLVTLRGHFISPDGLYIGCIRDSFPGTDGLDRASSLPGKEWLDAGHHERLGWIVAEGATLSKWQVATIAVLEDIFDHRVEQERRYGHVNDLLLDGTGPEMQWLTGVANQDATWIQENLRGDYEGFEAEHGLPTWMHLVREEIAEAFQESDEKRLEEELIQVAALCTSWVERIRARR